MEKLLIKNFGPIEEAKIDFGDLTFFVGPQATGKSIVLQLLKLLIDKNHIRKTLEQFNFVWGKNTELSLDQFFGEGMSKIWQSDSLVNLDGKKFTKDDLIAKQGRKSKTETDLEQLFYIPAQRILSVSDGRPKTFTEFDGTTPYVLRYFSEVLRMQFQKLILDKKEVFPSPQNLKEPLRQSFDDSIFHGAKIIIDESLGQRKFKMSTKDMNVPFITWSAGQKEFLPLLLSFYYLCPSSRVSRKDDFKFVILEEPEMGLHPKAILSVLLQIVDLVHRGYRVIVSTHSPIFLQYAWAVRVLLDRKLPDKKLREIFSNLFSVDKGPQTNPIFDSLTQKIIKCFYFSRGDLNGLVNVKDISTLDASDEDNDIADWGGLTDFVSKVYDNIP